VILVDPIRDGGEGPLPTSRSTAMNGPTVIDHRGGGVMRRLVRLCTLATFLILPFGVSAKDPKAGEVPVCEPGPDQVAFFEEKGFRGRCVVRGIGGYGDAAALGIRNDQLSSVKVGSGRQVVICTDTAFSGNCDLITADEPNLGRGAGERPPGLRSWTTAGCVVRAPRVPRSL
jgi:hypothetical protein